MADADIAVTLPLALATATTYNSISFSNLTVLKLLTLANKLRTFADL